MRTTVTITTDASFDHKHQVGGWACWVSAKHGSYKRSGVFKASPTTPADAEIKAAIIGLHIFLKLNLKTDKLILNSDNQLVVNILNKVASKSSFNVTPSAQDLVKYANKVRSTGVKLMSRHVKAHVRVLQARQYVNAWCDRQSRKEMRTERKKRYEPDTDN